VDNATPIIIDGVHYGNFFTGQFFLEKPDLNFFRAQAKKYGIDEDAYLEAVKKVPIWTQEQLNSYLFFIKGLIAVISESGLKKLREIEARKQIEKSEERHRVILQTAMDGFCLVDLQGHIKEVNDAYCKMSGYSEHELLAMNISDLDAAEATAEIATHMQKIISQGEDRFEAQHRRKDGAIFDVEISAQYHPIEGGRFVAFLRNITERKQAEEALRYERDLIERIMETSPAGITRVDANGRVVYANKRAEKILGMQLSPAAERAYNDPEWKITDFNGEPFPEEKLPFFIVKQTCQPVYNVQHAIEWPDGRRVLLSINATPLIDTSGAFDGMVAAIDDITERFKAEQNYQMLFREMLEGFALHEIICDDNGYPVNYRFLAVNPAFERQTGLKSETLIGKTVLEIMPQTEPY
jgi:PAS domain S-box-containing protein